MKRAVGVVLAALVLVLAVGCGAKAHLVVVPEVTPIGTNSYLVYDPTSKEAALFDVAGPIDQLESRIRDEGLNVEFFIFTHGHFDHLLGFPQVRDRYPGAKVVIHGDDYIDMQTQLQWVLDNMDPEFIDYLKSDPEKAKLLSFDVRAFGEPDIRVEDGQVLKLGKHNILSIHSPGHSRGSVCYYADGKLFSGDVLFHRSVGRTDVQNSSRADQIASVRRLYELPEDTVVYPAHGPVTDIGSERTENEDVTVDAVNLPAERGAATETSTDGSEAVPAP